MSLDEATSKVRSAIAQLLMSKETNWWGFLLCSFDLEATNSCPTMGITFNLNTLRPKIIFSPHFVLQLPTGEVGGVLIHEALHYLQMVFLRQGLREMKEWNVAADMPINWQIDTILGEHAKTDWGKKIRLPNTWTNEKGEECKPVRVPDSIANNERYAEWLYANMNEHEDLKETMSKVGTEYFLVDDHSLWGDFNKIPEEVLKSGIVKSINDASNTAGTMPGGVKQILDRLLDSKVSWNQELKDFVGQNQVIGKRQSWKKTSRRFGKRQPGKLVLRSGVIVFIMDTSASMSEEELEQGLAEADALSTMFDVWIVDCDTKVQRVYKYRRGLELSVKGGGGTNVNPALKHADIKLRADMIICFTDGGLFEKPIDTRAKQLYVITKGGTTSYVENKRHVKIEDD